MTKQSTPAVTDQSTPAVTNQSTSEESSQSPPKGSSVPSCNAPSELLDFLFIDADSKDPSLGLTAPPQSFITPEAITTFYHGTFLSAFIAF